MVLKVTPRRLQVKFGIVLRRIIARAERELAEYRLALDELEAAYLADYGEALPTSERGS